MHDAMRSGVIRLADYAVKVPTPEGERSVLALKRGTLDVRLSVPVPPNRQTPHEQDELYAVICGEGALIHELYKAGFTITDVNPDFVIVGETRSFNWEMMHKAAYFVANGARFIATNPDTHGRGFYPACGALCAGIESTARGERRT